MSQNGSRSGGRSPPLPYRFPKPPKSPRPTPSSGMPTAVDARTFSSLAMPTDSAPYLHVEIYRPGTEIRSFADPQAEIADGAATLGPEDPRRADRYLASKFGPLTVFFF